MSHIWIHKGKYDKCSTAYKRANEPIYWTLKPWEENQGWVKNDNSVLEQM